MNPKSDLSQYDDELTSKQVNEILNIYKNIKRSMYCKCVESEKLYGFTAPQLLVIFHLYETPSITLNELSDYMILTKSTVSGIVDRLANQGVVTREIPENNRRTVRLSISKEFEKKHNIAEIKKSFISNLISDNIKKLDPAEIEKIIYGLKQFNLLLKNTDTK